MLGELDTLLRDRCSRGDVGSEVDLRRTLRRGLSLTSDEVGCSLFKGAAFPRLPRNFKAALITSVDNMAFSFGDNSSSASVPFS